MKINKFIKDLYDGVKNTPEINPKEPFQIGIFYDFDAEIHEGLPKVYMVANTNFAQMRFSDEEWTDPETCLEEAIARCIYIIQHPDEAKAGIFND